METNLVETEWIDKPSIKWLKFNFIGQFTESIANSTIEKWKKELLAHLDSGEQANIIYNCIKMTGYDSAARIAWQKAMKELKPNINDIWIIAENKLILGAAKTMGVLTRFNIKATSSVTKIPFD